MNTSRKVKIVCLYVGNAYVYSKWLETQVSLSLSHTHTLSPHMTSSLYGQSLQGSQMSQSFRAEVVRRFCDNCLFHEEIVVCVATIPSSHILLSSCCCCSLSFFLSLFLSSLTHPLASLAHKCTYPPPPNLHPHTLWCGLPDFLFLLVQVCWYQNISLLPLLLFLTRYSASPSIFISFLHHHSSSSLPSYLLPLFCSCAPFLLCFMTFVINRLLQRHTSLLYLQISCKWLYWPWTIM